MSCDDEEIVIPDLNRMDFERARMTLAEYRDFVTYEDFRCDREGRLLGLAFAGQPARLARISFGGFLVWCANLGRPPTGAGLDAFAANGSDRRDSPPPLRRFLPPSDERIEPSPAGTNDAPVDPAAYGRWLACLGAASSPALLDAYAALVREASADPSARPTAFEPFERGLRPGRTTKTL